MPGPREARSRNSRGVLDALFFSGELSYRLPPPVHAGSIRPPNPDAFNATIQQPRPFEFVLVAPGRVLSPLSCSDGVFGHHSPRVASETIALIQQMARENSLWGVERIRGELMKLGIRVPRSTIQKYVRLARPHPAHGQNWPTFLKNHAQIIWACDFLPVMDLFFRQIYAFFIIEPGSRRVVHFGVTSHPTDAWVAQQLREATPYGLTPCFLICDRDSKHGDDFARVAKASSIDVLKTPYRAPKANAICERFLGSVRRECLDHLLVVGDRQLHRVIKEYVEYFNRARPHQGIGQRIPEGIGPQPAWPRRGRLITVPVLNGLHHDYRRAV